jgi:type IV pilus assembly protein PilV
MKSTMRADSIFLLPTTTAIARGRETKSRVRHGGFSLLEVLITIVVVAIGLLGVAGMQVASVKLSDLSAQRTTGINLTNEISNRIRANAPNVAAYQSDWGATASGTSVAAQDLALWRGANGLGAFPSGDGKITVSRDASCATVPLYPDCTLVTVEVRWDERRARGGNPTPTQTLFSTTFRI